VTGKVVEIDKTVSQSVTATVTFNIKWILADTEPAAPSGYVRYADFDIVLGVLGTLWAFRTS
jgi:hypothetical protein